MNKEKNQWIKIFHISLILLNQKQQEINEQVSNWKNIMQHNPNINNSQHHSNNHHHQQHQQSNDEQIYSNQQYNQPGFSAQSGGYPPQPGYNNQSGYNTGYNAPRP